MRSPAFAGASLAPGNKGPWDEVRRTLNRLSRGWCGYFSPGTHHVTDRAIEAQLYDRVRNFLVRRHKMPPRSIGPFSMEAAILVCRDCEICDGVASCREPVTKPAGKPDAGNPHVRFDERGGETERSRDTAPLLDSTVTLY